MTALKIIFGLLLIAVALHDMFHTLFHPSGRGALAEFISYRTWRTWQWFVRARHKTLEKNDETLLAGYAAVHFRQELRNS